MRASARVDRLRKERQLKLEQEALEAALAAAAAAAAAAAEAEAQARKDAEAAEAAAAAAQAEEAKAAARAQLDVTRAVMKAVVKLKEAIKFSGGENALATARDAEAAASEAADAVGECLDSCPDGMIAEAAEEEAVRLNPALVKLNLTAMQLSSSVKIKLDFDTSAFADEPVRDARSAAERTPGLSPSRGRATTFALLPAFEPLPPICPPSCLRVRTSCRSP